MGGTIRVNFKTDEQLSSKSVKIAPEFVRPSLARPFSFLSGKLVPLMQKQQQEETERELKLLYERYALEKRKPSGAETHSVRMRVKEKYHDIHLQNGLRAELWQLSERTLNILRTPGLCPVPDRGAILKAMQAFNEKTDGKYFPETDPGSPFYLGPRGYSEVKSSDVVGPNEYFEVTQPERVMNYGYPFYSSVPTQETDPLAPCKPVPEKVLGINTTFFGALMGGDWRLGHHVLFFLPEAKFYFYDLVIESYVPTTEAKLRLVLSVAIQRQAASLLVEQATIILNKFLIDAVLDQVMAKAKTMLGVERGFFEGQRAKPRIVVENQAARSIASTVKAFIESQIAVDETNVLTISECVAQFQSFCQERGESLPSFKEIKLIVQMKMREVYGKGLRNDLLLDDNRCVAGWKGLRLEKESEVHESGESDLSERGAAVFAANGN